MIHASTMGRVAACPGSFALCQQAPRRPSGEAAKEGTAAAKLAEQCLLTGRHPLEYAGTEVLGVMVDTEMATYISRYVDYCRSLPGTGVPERKWRNTALGLAGTCDYIAYDGHTLEIVDLKYGYGWVEAPENWQLLAYLALWHEEGDREPTAQMIRLTIVQPRASHPGGPVRSWEIPGDQLRAQCNHVINAVRLALSPNAGCVAGAHCRYCPAIVGCEANRRSVAECMDMAGVASYTEMTANLIAQELSALEYCQNMLNHRLTAVQEYTAGLIEAGTRVPGYEVSSAPGALAWTGDAIAQGDELGADLRAPAAPVTPTQAIARGLLPEGVVKMLSARKNGTPKLKKINLDAVKKLIKAAGPAAITRGE